MDNDKSCKPYRCLAVDGVIFLEKEVVLIKRNHPPFEGHWVLPGGMVEHGETITEACKREIDEEIGMKVKICDFIGLYDDPDRDERGNISASFICKPIEGVPTPEMEATDVDTFKKHSIPDLGFDHKKIVEDAFDHLN